MLELVCGKPHITQSTIKEQVKSILIRYIALCLAQVSPLAYGQNTNIDWTISSNAIDIVARCLNGRPNHGWSWWQWFEYHLVDNGRDNGYRRFGPLTYYSWTRSSVSDIEYGPDRAESQGESMFSDTLSHGAIDAFSSVINFDQFKNPRKPGTTFGAKLAEGTLNTLEGRMRPASFEPEDATSLNKWITSFITKDDIKYGFNLLNSNPYCYYSMAFWRRDNGIPYAVWTTRFRTMFTKLRFDRPRLEEEIVLPLNSRTHIATGCRLYPTAIDEIGWKPAVTMKITRKLESGVRNGNVFYASVQITEDESLCVIGITLDHLIWKN